MTTGGKGRSPLVNEAVLIEARAVLPYINFVNQRLTPINVCSVTR